MSKDQLVDRLLASQAGVDSWKLRNRYLSDDDFPKIGYAMGVLSEAPIFIDDSPGGNIMEIRAKARRLQMEHGLGLIIIDYLQLMSGKSRAGEANRVQEISEISRGLKGLARELNVPIIALSQLHVLLSIAMIRDRNFLTCVNQDRLSRRRYGHVFVQGRVLQS
jgi:replicative DNA helicase